MAKQGTEPESPHTTGQSRADPGVSDDSVQPQPGDQGQSQGMSAAWERPQLRRTVSESREALLWTRLGGLELKQEAPGVELGLGSPPCRPFSPGRCEQGSPRPKTQRGACTWGGV